MKRFIVVPFAAALLLSAWLFFPSGTLAQKSTTNFPSLPQQLSQKYNDEFVQADTPLADLIAANQDFSMLRSDELKDKRGLPPWLRVWWRKAHPEGNYNAADPTKGYPLVLKEVLEWMMSHQDLKPGPGINEETGQANSPFLDSLIGSNVRVSGAQAAARSESYIQINYFNPLQILVASNNISSSGSQGVYRSLDGGLNWSQSSLPISTGDSFHSDPTVDFASDGRFYSSTLGINSAGSVLKLRNYFSTDNGVTWTLDGTPSGTQTAVDKQIVWVDKSASSPYFGQMYAIWHNNNPAYMNRRTSGSAGTWLANPIQVSGAQTTGTAIGGDVKTNSTGVVFGFWPDTGSSKIYMVRSTDGGNTFGTPIQVATTKDSYDIGVPSFSSRRALLYVSGGAFKSVSKDQVYVTWTDLSGDSGCTAPANEPGTNAASTCKTRIWFARSIDGGTTWSAPIKINSQAGLNDQFNPWLAVDDTTGNIGIMYYDTVGDAGRKKTDVWFQGSLDGGVSWSASQKVSSSMTDETVSGSDSGNQYGDYNGLSAYANNFFPSWTDRRGAAKEEIWTSPVSLGAPAASISSGGVTYVSENAIPANSVPDPGETVTVSLGLQNVGNADSGNVTATLQASGGVTNPTNTQNYGSLAQGSAASSRNFTFIVNPAANCGSTITLTFSVQDGANSPTQVTQTYTLGTLVSGSATTFANTTAMTLTDGTAAAPAAATLYPSNIVVNGVPASSLYNIKVSVNGWTHTFPGDIDFLLVGPNGQKFEMISDQGSGGDISNINLTLDDAAANALPSTQLVAGTFRPGADSTTDTFPAPAPAGPYLTPASGGTATFASAFGSSNPNGTWSLYIVDDAPGDTGNISGGWSISISGASYICSSVGGSVRSRADFDGDGKSDVSVFRPSDGNWYQNNSLSGFAAMHWGQNGDVVVPGDYDGDGKADFSIWRPSDTPGTPDFYVLNSNGFTMTGMSLGITSDLPVTGDFDGDGKTDFAVYRVSAGSGYWFIYNSSTGLTSTLQFGAAGDVPFAMDNDGDGKANLAVFRPSSNTWFIARSTVSPSSNFDAVQFGQAGDIIVPADYDGDNKDDIAVFRPSNGVWYILQSSNGLVAASQFGQNGDVPVPGDYDGDGKDDTAVYRSGTWYINRSTSGFTAQSFGVATDVPVAAKYHP